MNPCQAKACVATRFDLAGRQKKCDGHPAEIEKWVLHARRLEVRRRPDYTAGMAEIAPRSKLERELTVAVEAVATAEAEVRKWKDKWKDEEQKRRRQQRTMHARLRPSVGVP